MMNIDDPLRLLDLGRQHQQARRFHEAEKLYRQVLARYPENADAWHLLGQIAQEAKQHVDAVRLVRRAIELDPRNAVFFATLATSLEREGDDDAAVEALEQAIRLRPDYLAGYNNLAEVYKNRCEIGRALACYDAALARRPDFLVCRSNQLMVMHYDATISRQSLYDAHRRWAEMAERRAAPPPVHANSRDENRPIRLGYLSPDFREHAVARFFAPILEHHDRGRFAVYLYDAHPLDDATSRQFRRQAALWRPIEHLSTADAAAAIQRDAIDILVDLAGHTAHHRLDVMAAKPAPVQVTYLGYPDTTGLSAIDYRLSDDVLDPPGEPSYSSEQIVRLPGGFCTFEPPSHAPAVSPPPVLQSGRVTFGAHHATPKLNQGVFQLWHEIVAAVPDSRVLFVRSSLTPSVVARLSGQLREVGFRDHQFTFFRPTDTRVSYLAPQADVDIALDCFPYTGHTTTCEELWMGVPVVTLAGDRPAARASASVLASVGLPELVARTPGEYLQIAVRLASDTALLARLRGELRGRMAATLVDAAAFTRRLEAAYRAMWKTWCQK